MTDMVVNFLIRKKAKAISFAFTFFALAACNKANIDKPKSATDNQVIVYTSILESNDLKFAHKNRLMWFKFHNQPEEEADTYPHFSISLCPDTTSFSICLTDEKVEIMNFEKVSEGKEEFIDFSVESMAFGSYDNCLKIYLSTKGVQNKPLSERAKWLFFCDGIGVVALAFLPLDKSGTPFVVPNYDRDFFDDVYILNGKIGAFSQCSIKSRLTKKGLSKYIDCSELLPKK